MTVTITPLSEREFFAWYSLFAEYAAGAGVGCHGRACDARLDGAAEAGRARRGRARRVGRGHRVRARAALRAPAAGRRRPPDRGPLRRTDAARPGCRDGARRARARRGREPTARAAALERAGRRPGREGASRTSSPTLPAAGSCRRCRWADVQLGTRWAVGASAPDRIPQPVLAAIRTVEAELEESDVSTSGWSWTLTYLEGKPIVDPRRRHPHPARRRRGGAGHLHRPGRPGRRGRLTTDSETEHRKGDRR